MRDKIFFTVGPSALYHKVSEWTADFFQLGLGSIYHRSSEFRRMYKDLDEQLRCLMNIPESHAICISSSGSEIMERIIQNTVRKESFHFVNGAFSSKFYEYAQRLNISASKYEVPNGEGFDHIPTIPGSAELICITHNETSTGIKTNEEFIHNVGRTYSDKILAVDSVSSAPFVQLDFSLVDISFFSSQKAFGLPSGLGVFIINKCLMEKMANEKISNGRGAHNTFADYSKSYNLFETPSTPNVLGVYLLAKVAEEYNRIGLSSLMKECIEKKTRMHTIFTSNAYLRLKNENNFSSDTVVVADFLKPRDEVIHLLSSNHIVCSNGYGPNKETQLRFSNFPANTWKEIDFLEKVLSI